MERKPRKFRHLILGILSIGLVILACNSLFQRSTSGSVSTPTNVPSIPITGDTATQEILSTDEPTGIPVVMEVPEPDLGSTIRWIDGSLLVYIPPGEFAQKNTLLSELTRQAGRDPDEIKRSIMIGCEYGRDEAEVKALVEKRTKGQRTAEELINTFGMAVGTPAQIVDHLGDMAEAGVQRVMLQWLDLDDTYRLESLAEEVLPGCRPLQRIVSGGGL